MNDSKTVKDDRATTKPAPPARHWGDTKFAEDAAFALCLLALMLGSAAILYVITH